MVNSLVVDFYRAKFIEQLAEEGSLADLRLRFDFKAKEIRTTIFNSVVATGTVYLSGNTVFVDIDDNLFMKRHVGVYNDINYVAYVFKNLIDTIRRWTLNFFDRMPTPARLASPNAPGESPFLPPGPGFVSARSRITGTIVGDFFAYLSDWAKNNNVSFIEFELHHETASITVRWDKYTVYITPENALVMDNKGNALAVNDPDTYYSIVSHTDTLAQFGYAPEAVFSVYNPNTAPDAQVGPTVFEYVLTSYALFNIADLKYQR
jgi:hypothetical protein